MRALPPRSPHLPHCVPQWVPFLSRAAGEDTGLANNAHAFLLHAELVKYFIGLPVQLWVVLIRPPLPFLFAGEAIGWGLRCREDETTLAIPVPARRQ